MLRWWIFKSKIVLYFDCIQWDWKAKGSELFGKAVTWNSQVSPSKLTITGIRLKCSAWIWCTGVEWRSLLMCAALWYAWSRALLCLTRNSPHKKDTAFFVCFYFTFLCPAEFCLCWLLPLCSLGAVMPSRKVVTLGSSFKSQWDGKGLLWRCKGCFSGCFWKVAHVLGYYADTLKFLVYYRDWTWLEKSCSVLCPGTHIFKISSKKKKTQKK